MYCSNFAHSACKQKKRGCVCSHAGALASLPSAHLPSKTVRVARRGWLQLPASSASRYSTRAPRRPFALRSPSARFSLVSQTARGVAPSRPRRATSKNERRTGALDGQRRARPSTTGSPEDQSAQKKHPELRRSARAPRRRARRWRGTGRRPTGARGGASRARSRAPRARAVPGPVSSSTSPRGLFLRLVVALSPRVCCSFRRV